MRGPGQSLLMTPAHACDTFSMFVSHYWRVFKFPYECILRYFANYISHIFPDRGPGQVELVSRLEYEPIHSIPK